VSRYTCELTEVHIVRRISLASVLVSLAVTVSAKDCSTSKGFTLQQSQQLSGVFVDTSHATLPGIRIQLLSGKKVIHDIRTNNQGAYDFGEVPAGSYKIRVLYGDHTFCAPLIQCNSKECQIEPELAINPKNTVTVR